MSASLAISYDINAVDRITNKLRKISTEVKLADAQFQKIDKTAAKAEKNVGKFANKFKGLSLARNKLTALGTAALATFSATKILQKGMDFEDSVASIQAITGAAGDDLDYFADKSIELSKKFGVAASEVATSIKDIASGKSELLEDPEGLIKVTEQVLTMSKAAGITAPEATRSLVEALNQWSVGADKAAEFTNILAAGAKVGAAEIPFMAGALKNAGGIAANANLSFAETNAALQAMAKSGLKGEIAGTGLAGVLRRMSQLGLDVKKNGLIPTLEKIQKVTDKKNLNLADPNLFGEHGKSIIALLSNLRSLKKFKAEIQGTNEAQRQAEARTNTLRARMKRLGARIDEAMLGAFKKLEPVITNIVTRLTDSIDNMDEQKVAQIGTAMETLAGGIQAVFNGFVGLLNILNKIGNWMGTTAGKLFLALTGKDDPLARGEAAASLAERGKYRGAGARKNAPLSMGESWNRIVGEDSALSVDINVKGGDKLEDKPTVRKRTGRKVKTKTNMQ